MPRVSKFYRLGKSQAELDFVDVPVGGDMPLFIDPFAISQRVDRLSEKCQRLIATFFQNVVDSIRSGREREAKQLLLNLREPNETRFGYSSGVPQGAGIGRYQAQQLFEALRESSAVKTGFISSLEESELMIDGISYDKISDLTTNVIRMLLAEYTKQQCLLLGIPTQEVALAPHFSPDANRWVSQYFDLPVAGGRPLLLVPKAFARYDPAYNHHTYYRRFVVDYLRTEALDADSSLVHTLKNGRRVVYVKDVQATFPCTKENLFQFSRQHPEVLGEYRDELTKLEQKGPTALVTPKDERLIAKTIATALRSIPPGGDSASEYHSLMIGVVEFLFFPKLLHPAKEREIHEGRKRIDISMENGARAGIFYRLHQIRKLPCAFVAFECKNYSRDVANPELDQLAGRFSVNRGKFGILCCRSFRDRKLFLKRCRDTLKDDRGLIIPLDDKRVLGLLGLIVKGEQRFLDNRITEFVDEVWCD